MSVRIVQSFDDYDHVNISIRHNYGTEAESSISESMRIFVDADDDEISHNFYIYVIHSEPYLQDYTIFKLQSAVHPIKPFRCYRRINPDSKLANEYLLENLE